jgi:hypothetical protein
MYPLGSIDRESLPLDCRKTIFVIVHNLMRRAGRKLAIGCRFCCLSANKKVSDESLGRRICCFFRLF